MKISFCIVCMNRLHHLKKTLPENIRDNSEHKDLEFVILDYNSEDGMGKWIKDNFENEMISGKLVYYHTSEPKVFSHSHSKNVVSKIATGKIICNINADHYTGKGFATYVEEVFSKDENAVLTTVDMHKTSQNYHPSKDNFGRFCVSKENFLNVKGFDERMQGYGFEDWDFINRLEMKGVKRVLIKDRSFLNFITHQEEERYKLSADNLNNIFISYLDPSVSIVIFLYKSQRFEKGVLIDNSSVNAENTVFAYQPREYRFEYTVQGHGWTNGSYHQNTNGSIVLSTDIGEKCVLEIKDDPIHVLVDNVADQTFYALEDEGVVDSLLRFNYFFFNRSIMEKNMLDQTPVTNRNDFGLASLSKNFSLAFTHE